MWDMPVTLAKEGGKQGHHYKFEASLDARPRCYPQSQNTNNKQKPPITINVTVDETNEPFQ